jgi:phenylacetate-coenzyme A ligase PaaK-like adenylate-forming protein
MPALRVDAAEPLATIVRRLNGWQPEVLAVYPSVLAQLADEQIAGRLHIRLRSVATSAEVLSGETSSINYWKPYPPPVGRFARTTMGCRCCS